MSCQHKFVLDTPAISEIVFESGSYDAQLLSA
jgi:hypothetical protein